MEIEEKVENQSEAITQDSLMALNSEILAKYVGVKKEMMKAKDGKSNQVIIEKMYF